VFLLIKLFFLKEKFGYDTAGGPMRVYIVPDSVWVSLLAEEQDSENILSDMVISHTEVELR
jgi:hypothetical protein